MDFLNTAYNIFIIIFGFGFLIFIHELGHFLAAKWAGVRAEAFAVGMGHVVCAWRKGIGFTLGSTHKKVVAKTGKPAHELSDAQLDEHNLGETEYSLRWLPVGGFVKMLGQDAINPAAVSQNARSFNVCSIPKRMVIISAGVIMNVILAAVLFIIAFMVGVRFEAPVIGNVNATQTAATTKARNADLVGILPGDRILSINGEPASTFADLSIASAMGKPGETMTVEVERPGLTEPLLFDLHPEPDPNTGMLSIGVTPGLSATVRPPDRKGLVQSELDRIGIGQSGVQPGMTLLTVNGESINSFAQFTRFLSHSDGSILHTTWSHLNQQGDRQGASVEVALPLRPEYAIQRYPQPDKDIPIDYENGLLGLVPLVKISHFEPTSLNAQVLRAGDIVLQFGDLATPRMADFHRFVRQHKSEAVEMTVLRDGTETKLTVQISRKGKVGVYLAYALESPYFAAPLPQVLEPQSEHETNTPIKELNLHGGMRFVAVNDTPLQNWADLRQSLRQSTRAAHDSGSDATLTLSFAEPGPDSSPVQHEITLSNQNLADLHNLGWTTELSSNIFQPTFATLSAHGNPLRAVSMGLNETKKVITLTYLTIDRLFRGTVGVEQLRGPVGIVHIGSKIVDRGPMYMFFFFAMISVNLAVINFLPLPIVDGGLFLFLIYEKFKGKPPSIAFQNAATIVGLALIGAIFLITFYNDVMRLLP